MSVVIGQSNPVTSDYFSTWGKLRSPILGQDGYSFFYLDPFSAEYEAGSGFLTDNDTPIRFDMRSDDGPVTGYWRPNFSFFLEDLADPPGWYASMSAENPSLTNEDIFELVGETVVASGSPGTFVIDADFFYPYPGQLIQAGTGFTPPYPVTFPVLSCGKLNPF